MIHRAQGALIYKIYKMEKWESLSDKTYIVQSKKQLE